jgi:hypothetical protein
MFGVFRGQLCGRDSIRENWRKSKGKIRAHNYPEARMAPISTRVCSPF